jgi:hypothetical protein
MFGDGISALDTTAVDSGSSLGAAGSNAAATIGNIGAVNNAATGIPNILSSSGQSMLNPASVGMGQSVTQDAAQSLGQDASQSMMQNPSIVNPSSISASPQLPIASTADTAAATAATANPSVSTPDLTSAPTSLKDRISNALNLNPTSYGSKALNFLGNQDPATLAGIGALGYGGYKLLKPTPIKQPTIAPYSGPLSKIHYDPSSFVATNTAQPVAYQPQYTNYQTAAQGGLMQSYAQGGIAAMAPGGGIQGQTAGMGNNQMYPQGQLDSTQFATPSQMPISTSLLNNTNMEQKTNPYTGEPTGMAGGGIASLGGYAHGGNPQLLDGPGDGMSDSIPASIGNRQPARLAQGEFVVPADVVSHLGNGSTDAGAKHLYDMMDKIRKARTGNPKQGKQINASKFLPA